MKERKERERELCGKEPYSESFDSTLDKNGFKKLSKQYHFADLASGFSVLELFM